MSGISCRCVDLVWEKYIEFGISVVIKLTTKLLVKIGFSDLI
jgi:hypothetical protein